MISAILAQTAIDPAFLAVRKDSPINSVEDFVRAAESGKMLVGCIDYFGPTNFAALKMHKAGIPYSMTSFGSGPKTISAMLGGHVDAAFLMTGTSMSSISEMKVLAIATAERDPMFPMCRLSVNWAMISSITCTGSGWLRSSGRKWNSAWLTDCAPSTTGRKSSKKRQGRASGAVP